MYPQRGQEAFSEHHRYHLNLTEQMVASLSEEESSLMLSLLKKINREVF